MVCRCKTNTILLSDYLFNLLLKFNNSHLFWLCLFSSSVFRIPFRIFCSGGLVIMYSFCFCLSWKIFIRPSIPNDSFAEVIFFQCSKYLTSCLLVFKILVGKFAVILMGLLYMLLNFSFLHPSIYFLCSLS
jgi:hypothetical protein